MTKTEQAAKLLLAYESRLPTNGQADLKGRMAAMEDAMLSIGALVPDYEVSRVGTTVSRGMVGYNKP